MAASGRPTLAGFDAGWFLHLTAQGKDRNHRRAALGVQRMRKATWWMLSVALVVLVAAPALLAEEAKAPAEKKVKAAAKESGDSKEKPGLKGEYAIMAGELNLTSHATKPSPHGRRTMPPRSSPPRNPSRKPRNRAIKKPRRRPAKR